VSGSVVSIGEQVLKDPFRLSTLAFHSGIALSSRRALQYTARYQDSRSQGFPLGSGGPDYSILRNPQIFNVRQFVTGAGFEHAVSDLWSYRVNVDLFHRGTDSQVPAILNAMPPSNRSQPESEGRTSFERYRGRFVNSFRLSRHWSGQVAGEFREERGNRDATLAAAIPDRFSLVRSTGSAVAEGLYTNGNWTLTAGGRADKTGGYAAIYSPRAGMNYRLRRGGMRVRISWGRGYKLPSFYALGDPLIGNRNLRPEYAESAEGGLTGELIGNRVRWEATYFVTWYRDLVDFSPQQFRLINRSQVRTRGLEFATQYTIAPKLRVAASFSALGWSLNPGNETLRNVPRWRGTATADWQASAKWHLGADSHKR
jgi:vitamin B12 transporter